jgi:prevent-host-death family protein
MLTADLAEAGRQLSDLIDAALRGEEVVIARNGEPAVRLVPASDKARFRQGGFWRDKVKIIDPDWDKPDPEIERLSYEGDLFPKSKRDAAGATGRPEADDGPSSR